MYNLLYDRIFWIYFIIALFFIILGIGFIISATDTYMLIIALLWLLSVILLLIIVYHGSIYWSPGPPNNPICVADGTTSYFDPSNRVWLSINILFVLLLVFSVLWAAELINVDGGVLRMLSGVLILLGGLILCTLSTNYSYLNAAVPFWASVAYLFIWFGLTMYIIMTSP